MTVIYSRYYVLTLRWTVRMEIPVHEAVDHILVREELQQLLPILDDAPGGEDEFRRPQSLVGITEVLLVLLVLLEVALEILDLGRPVILMERRLCKGNLKKLTSSSIAMKCVAPT